jgi:hypothetical protein
VGRLSIAILMSMALLLMLVAPVAATVRQPTGPRLNLFLGNQSYQASTAFHIRDGWLLDSTTIDAIGRYSFTLDVDGSPRASDFRTSQEFADGFVAKTWYFNFPVGMTGTHTFVGHFLGPCGGSFPCNGLPAESVIELGTLTATVTFF